MLDDLDDPRTPRVCLLARSVSSDVLAERDLQKFVQADMAAFVGAFSNRLRSAKDTGELPSEFDAEGVAQIIATYLQGLFRTALLSYDRSQLERQVQPVPYQPRPLAKRGAGRHRHTWDKQKFLMIPPMIGSASPDLWVGGVQKLVGMVVHLHSAAAGK